MKETKETQAESPGGEDALEEGMVIHSSILACRIPRTEEQAWQSTVHGVTKSRTRLRSVSTHAHACCPSWRGQPWCLQSPDAPRDGTAPSCSKTKAHAMRQRLCGPTSPHFPREPSELQHPHFPNEPQGRSHPRTGFLFGQQDIYPKVRVVAGTSALVSTSCVTLAK